MRKAALAGVRARAEMIRSPSFSRDSESRTTMASPRAVEKGGLLVLCVVLGQSEKKNGLEETHRMPRWLLGWC